MSNFLKKIIDAHNVSSDHVPSKGKIKKDDSAPKTEEEAKELAFAQVNLKGNTYFMYGKKNCFANTCHQKDKTSYKYWTAREKKNPENVTDDDDDRTPPLTGVHCIGRAGMYKNACTHKFNNAKNVLKN